MECKSMRLVCAPFLTVAATTRVSTLKAVVAEEEEPVEKMDEKEETEVEKEDEAAQENAKEVQRSLCFANKQLYSKMRWFQRKPAYI
jgi:hypothetical protein